MHLVTAWVASALAGAVAHEVGGLIAAAAMGAPVFVFLSTALLRSGLHVFAFCLVFQLIYGGLLYLVLAHRGLLTFPVVLVAYLVPLMLLIWTGSDRFKDLIMAIPLFLCGITLAVVAWLLGKA